MKKTTNKEAAKNSHLKAFGALPAAKKAVGFMFKKKGKK
jgi:hypothetical protein